MVGQGVEVIGRLEFLLYSISATIRRYVARMTPTAHDFARCPMAAVYFYSPGVHAVYTAIARPIRATGRGIAWYPPRQTDAPPRAPPAIDRTASGLTAGQGERECRRKGILPPNMTRSAAKTHHRPQIENATSQLEPWLGDMNNLPGVSRWIPSFYSRVPNMPIAIPRSKDRKSGDTMNLDCWIYPICMHVATRSIV